MFVEVKAIRGLCYMSYEFDVKYIFSVYVYNVYRKDRNLHGGGVILLVHKDISHMPITELENNSESVWVKVFANKTSHCMASWYRQPGGSSEDFQLFRVQLYNSTNQHKGKKKKSLGSR